MNSNEKDIQDLLNKGKIFYKFSKSKEEYVSKTSEAFHRDYPENSVINGTDRGLSFCDNIQTLLFCCGYGDQITQVIIDKNSHFYDAVVKTLEKDEDTYNTYNEYRAHTMQTGKNYSLKDPTVLNALIQNAKPEALEHFITYKNNISKPIEVIYEEYGFKETAAFVRELKSAVYNEFGLNIYNDVRKTQRIKEIAASLIEKYKDSSKEDFSFKKAEKEYEAIKETTVDRRKEKTDMIKKDDFYVGPLHDAVKYLDINYFTKEQTITIMRIVVDNEIFEADKLNVFLPKFLPEFSNDFLINIRSEIKNNKMSFDEICNFLDGIYEEKISKKQSL